MQQGVELGGDEFARLAKPIEQSARAGLAGRPAEALAITQAHAAEFPAGKLSVERELLAIDALGRLGRATEARARAEGLLARARGSLYEDRIRAILGGLPSQSADPSSNR